MGQPRPTLFVPHFALARPAPAPLARQPAAAGPQQLPDNMRVTRLLQRHNNIPPLNAVYKQFQFMYNQSVASGPSLVSDIYGLPLVRPGCRVPSWMKRRRRYLKKLSPAARNALLTGDPFFTFDNTAYDAEWISLLPPAPVAAPAAPVPLGPVLPPPPPAAVALPPVPPVVPPDQDPFHRRTRRTPVDDSFSNLFGSSTPETPPRGLFDPSPLGSPSSPSPVSPDAPPSGCLLPGPSTLPSASVVSPDVALDGSGQPPYWL
jgi:hypothetical protein